MESQMAVDYAKEKIHVNCICPGFTNTPLIEHPLSDPDTNAYLTSLHPWGALGETQDVAGAALFVCSDDA